MLVLFYMDNFCYALITIGSVYRRTGILPEWAKKTTRFSLQ